MKLNFYKIIHWAIILTLVQEFLYASYMIFFVVRPESHQGPLLAKAKEIPFELMVTRRLYAIEAWIAFGALAIYLAITVILPKLRPDKI